MNSPSGCAHDPSLPSLPSLPVLPARDPFGHKGTFGTVGILGGKASHPDVMVGAPAFAASAALRAGAGRAVLAVPAPIMAAALVLAPGATGLALPVDRTRALRPSEAARLLDERMSDFRCLAIGPGWGAERPQQQILVRLLARDRLPIVVDADAINAMASLPDIQGDLAAPIVLTPHPGEYRRLAAHLDINADPTHADTRSAAAEQLARRLGCVVVLKGPNTVVSDGITSSVNESGNVALATAGTGDVLTGLIAGFVAQFHGAGGDAALSLLDCTRLAVHVHGRAADAWAAEHGPTGMLATDLVHAIPGAIQELPRRS